MGNEQGNGKGKLIVFDDMFFTEDDTQYHEVSVPEWGGKVRLASLTADLLIRWSQQNQEFEEEHKTEIEKAKTNKGKMPNDRTVGYRLLIASLVNEKGERIGLAEDGLTPKPDLVAKFQKRNPVATARLIQKVYAMNGMGKEDVAERKNDSSEVASTSSPTA